VSLTRESSKDIPSPRLLARARRSAAWWWPLVRLAPGGRERSRLATVVALVLAGRRLGRTTRPRSLKLRAHGAVVRFTVAGLGDLLALREVFVSGDYELELPGPPARVVDLGANIGAASVYFATRWPAARILALEPDPETFERLARNTEAFPTITAERLAVAGSAGELRIRPSAWGDSLTSTTLGGAGEGRAVGAVTLDGLVERCGGRIDLLKFDVEGMELEMLSAARRLDDIGTLVGELHEKMMGAPAEEVARLLSGHSVEIEPLPGGQKLLRARPQ
jgi:FkbM family methyltransferase